jgi:hypothetical protein
VTLTQQIHESALEHLREARIAVQKLASLSGDHVAKLHLEYALADAEKAVLEFGRVQLLLPHI